MDVNISPYPIQMLNSSLLDKTTPEVIVKTVMNEGCKNKLYHKNITYILNPNTNSFDWSFLQPVSLHLCTQWNISSTLTDILTWTHRSVSVWRMSRLKMTPGPYAAQRAILLGLCLNTQYNQYHCKDKYSLLMHCIKIKSPVKFLLNEQYVFVGGNISFLCVLSCSSEEA